MKKTLMLLTALLLMFACGCGRSDAEPVSSAETAQPKQEEEASTMSEQNPIATITMQDGSVITAELYYDVAPNTVTNFIFLANSGFYDGVIFHRVIPGFMIQGGDPTGTGRGGPDYRIKGEFTNNNFQNDLKHTRGVLSMARQGNPYMPSAAYNTAGSQFFIMHADAPSLDKDYASFGMVTSGMEIVDAIANAKTDQNDKPLTDQAISSIRVETFGKEYGEPNRIVD